MRIAVGLECFGGDEHTRQKRGRTTNETDRSEETVEGFVLQSLLGVLVSVSHPSIRHDAC